MCFLFVFFVGVSFMICKCLAFSRSVLQRILILIIHLILQRKEPRLKEVESCPRSADGKFQNQLESAGSRTGCSVVSCPDSRPLLAGINPAKWNLTLLFKK